MRSRAIFLMLFLSITPLQIVSCENGTSNSTYGGIMPDFNELLPIFTNDQAQPIAQGIVQLAEGNPNYVLNQTRYDLPFLIKVKTYLKARTLIQMISAEMPDAGKLQLVNDQQVFSSFMNALTGPFANQVRAAIDRLSSRRYSFFETLSVLFALAPAPSEALLKDLVNSENKALQTEPKTAHKKKKNRKKKKRTTASLSAVSRADAQSSAHTSNPFCEFAQHQLATPALDTTQNNPAAPEQRIKRIIQKQRELLYQSLQLIKTADSTINPQLLLLQQATGYRKLVLAMSTYTQFLGSSGMVLTTRVPTDLSLKEELFSAFLMHYLHINLSAALSTVQDSSTPYHKHIEKIKSITTSSSRPVILEVEKALLQEEQRLLTITRRGLQWASYLLSLEQPYDVVIETAQDYHGVVDVGAPSTAFLDALNGLREAFQVRMIELCILSIVYQNTKIIRTKRSDMVGVRALINLIEALLSVMTTSLHESWQTNPWGLPTDSSLASERQEELALLKDIQTRLLNLSADTHLEFFAKPRKKQHTKKPVLSEQPNAQSDVQLDVQDNQEEKEDLNPLPLILDDTEDVLCAEFKESVEQVREELALMVNLPALAEHKTCAARKPDSKNHKITQELTVFLRKPPHLKIHKTAIIALIKALGGEVKPAPGNSNSIYFKGHRVDHFELYHKRTKDRRGYLTSYWIRRVFEAIVSAALRGLLAPDMIKLLPDGWNTIEFGPRFQYKQGNQITDTKRR